MMSALPLATFCESSSASKQRAPSRRQSVTTFFSRSTRLQDSVTTFRFQLIIKSSTERSEKGWLNTKREMAFAKVTQDGDVDGCMFMARLPTEAEAKVIRSRLGILKKREVGELELERLRTQMASFNAQRVEA